MSAPYAFGSPCDYCGTMLDEHGCEESYVQAAGGGPISHFTSVCRERVHAALRAERAARATAEQECAELRADISAVKRDYMANLGASESARAEAEAKLATARECAMQIADGGCNGVCEGGCSWCWATDVDSTYDPVRGALHHVDCPVMQILEVARAALAAKTDATK